MLSLICTALFAAVLTPAFAQSRQVSSLKELQAAVDKAKPGDVIKVADGVYLATEDIVIAAEGSAGHPITIESQNAGKAEITGNGGFNIGSNASYIVIRGFKFNNAASKTKTGPNTSFCRFTQNVFENTGDGEDLTIAGSDQEVDHNTFDHKNAMGRFIAIRGKGSQIAERLHIHHNYFNDFKPQGGKNGAEAFQFGLSGFSLSMSNSIVEYNLFEHCAGENELISVKASGVTLRYNTIRDCPAQFTLRHGNKSQVYGNYFFNTPGLRIFGDDHVIHSNYFENCETGIVIGNGDGEVADGAQLTAHDRPDRVLIAFNTLIGNKIHISQLQRKGGMGATVITIACNVIQGGGTAAVISGPLREGKWEGNMIFNVKATGDLPAGTYTVIDPKLQKTASGAFHLTAQSPGINKVTTSYPGVTTDMDGQHRAAPFDIGADEFSNDSAKAQPLFPKDTGVQSL